MSLGTSHRLVQVMMSLINIYITHYMYSNLVWVFGLYVHCTITSRLGHYCFSWEHLTQVEVMYIFFIEFLLNFKKYDFEFEYKR